MRVVKAVIIAHNQYSQVQAELECLQNWNGVLPENIVIVDNNSSDELSQWLQQTAYDQIICQDEAEPFANILNKLMEEYAEHSDILLINPDFLLMPEAVKLLQSNLAEAAESVGAVCPHVMQQGAADYPADIDQVVARSVELRQQSAKVLGEKICMPSPCCLISGRLLLAAGQADTKLLRWDSTLIDLSFRGLKQGFQYLEVKSACAWQLSDTKRSYDNDESYAADQAAMQKSGVWIALQSWRRVHISTQLQGKMQLIFICGRKYSRCSSK